MKSQERLLILDPFENLLHIYQMFLENEKFSVDTASNLKEASQRLLGGHYAALITEFFPPFEEMFQMLQQVKAHLPEIYILTVTGMTVDEKTYERLFEIGVNDFIMKPYSPVKILTHVKKGIRNRDLIIKIRELEEESLTDPIASKIEQPIFNLPHFGKCLRQELKRAKRHEHPLSLLLMEIPGQEKSWDPVESFYVELIRLLRNNTREEDIVGRENGGFGILLPETDGTGSHALVNRLLRLINAHPSFQTDDHLRSLVKDISFKVFTYPEAFSIPKPLMAMLTDIPGISPHP